MTLELCPSGTWPALKRVLRPKQEIFPLKDPSLGDALLMAATPSPCVAGTTTHQHLRRQERVAHPECILAPISAPTLRRHRLWAPVRGLCQRRSVQALGIFTVSSVAVGCAAPALATAVLAAPAAKQGCIMLGGLILSRWLLERPKQVVGGIMGAAAAIAAAIFVLPTAPLASLGAAAAFGGLVGGYDGTYHLLKSAGEKAVSILGTSLMRLLLVVSIVLVFSLLVQAQIARLALSVSASA